jgi:hypothetical protein
MSIYMGDGDDTLTLSGKSGRTVYLMDGDDLLVAGAGTDTITGGAGVDTYRINLSTATDDTITDFAVGTDVLQLHGTGGTINVAGQSGSSGVYAFAPGMSGGSATLTGVTATDFSESIQLGYSLNNQVIHSINAATALVAGSSFVDYVQTTASADSTFTLGAGQDYIELNLTVGGASLKAADTGGFSAGESTTVTDFVVGDDVLIITGTAHLAGSTGINVHNMSGLISSGFYRFTASAGITLKNGGTGLSTTDMASSIQFGHSGAGTDAFQLGISSSVVLGDLNDFVKIGSYADSVGRSTATGTLTVKDDGGIDFLTVGSSVEIRYDLTGISLDLVTGIDAGATKISNALSGTTFVFANGESGTAGAAIEYVGSAAVSVGQAAVDDVATFLNAALGGTTGETYVAIINDLSGQAAYTYLVSEGGDGVITGDELTLLTVIDRVDDGSTATTLDENDFKA